MSTLSTVQNAIDRQAEKAKAAEPPPLNPPFPFVVQSIDLDFYGLTEDPPIDTKAEK